VKALAESMGFFCCEGVMCLSGYVMPEDEFPGSLDDLSDVDEDEELEEQAEDESDEGMSEPNVSYCCCMLIVP